MPLRITTWNVNGIRNPLGYPPWNQTKSFSSMFDILEADIVCCQELKIQRKNLGDDLVLIDGWDCYFSLPKHQGGYSGVGVWCRQSKCQPIRVEEGITGILCPPGKDTPYMSLPEDQQIGGYPDVPPESATILDSEGRVLVVDFGAFLLINVYCPATRDEARHDFRVTFIQTLFERVRNLVEVMKRKVVVVGDFNISRDAIDQAGAVEAMKAQGLEDFKLTETRWALHELLEPYETGCMVDLCREYWPDRRGMYTQWETKINARPGNFGSRIDYVICSSDMRDWFIEANIQEGLLGSDHCPVYGVIKDKVEVDGKEVDIRDICNPSGLFFNGEKIGKMTHSMLPPQSGRLLPEFSGRRTIKDMFARKPSVPKAPVERSSTTSTVVTPSTDTVSAPSKESIPTLVSQTAVVEGPPIKRTTSTRAPSKLSKPAPATSSKKRKLNTTTTTTKLAKSSIQSFFKPPSSAAVEPVPENEPLPSPAPTQSTPTPQTSPSKRPPSSHSPGSNPSATAATWSSLFTPPPVPKCTGHNEPCIQFKTKKPGTNHGRAFWMCSRPVGPEGQGRSYESDKRREEMVEVEVEGEDEAKKEQVERLRKEKREGDAQWRCGYFKWASDWKAECSSGGNSGAGKRKGRS